MRRRPILLTVLLALALLASAAPAEAAKRKVPFGFFGTVFNNTQADRSPMPPWTPRWPQWPATESSRCATRSRWAQAEPARGRYNFAPYDRVVRAAARHRLEVLPIVISTPRWASSRPLSPSLHLYAPKSSSTYARFLRTLVRRYGPTGHRSGAPRARRRSRSGAGRSGTSRPLTSSGPPAPGRRPTRACSSRPTVRSSAPTEAPLSSWAASRASRAARPGHRCERSTRPGARKYFSAISLHFFSSSPSVRLTVRQTLEIASSDPARDAPRPRPQEADLVHRAHVDRRAGPDPAWRPAGLRDHPAGQAARLNAVFSRLARDRKKRGIGKVYWYNWASEYEPTFQPGGPGSLTFQYAGLNKIAGTNVTPRPLLGTFARMAARYQGCRKTDNARRCR